MPETEEHIYSSTVATFLASTNFTPWRDDPSDGSACRADHHYDQRGVILWKQICRHGIHAIQRPSLRIRDTRQVTLTMSEEKATNITSPRRQSTAHKLRTHRRETRGKRYTAT